MCEALVSGILKSSLAESSDVVVSDPSVDRRSHLEDLYSIETVSNNTDLLDRDGIIVIAVKPQILSYVLSDLDGRLRADRTVASIVAGRSGCFIATILKPSVHPGRHSWIVCHLNSLVRRSFGTSEGKMRDTM